MAFGGVESAEEFVLDGVGVSLQLVEVLLSGVGEGDDIAPSVCGIDPPVYVVAGLEAAEDSVDVVAVETEATPEFGLAEISVLLERGPGQRSPSGRSLAYAGR